MDSSVWAAQPTLIANTFVPVIRDLLSAITDATSTERAVRHLSCILFNWVNVRLADGHLMQAVTECSSNVL